MKKNIQCILFAASLLIIGCSSKIRMITAYDDQDGIIVKRKETYFNKKGNEIKEITYGKNFNNIRTTNYNNGLKLSRSDCNLSPNNATYCQFTSKFKYDAVTKTEIETVYVKDSLIWLIRQRKAGNRIMTVKTFAWEDDAAIVPDYNTAFIITDTLFFDNKQRLVKKVSYSRIRKKPFISLYSYTDSGYDYEISGTRVDTVIHFDYSKSQKIIIKKIPDYEFYYPKQLTYKIEYF